MVTLAVEETSPTPGHASPGKMKMKMERKVIEKNRRNHMKNLYSNLISLLPHRHSVGSMALPDQLDEAAKYIKKLEQRLEEAKERKSKLLGVGRKRACTETICSLKSPKMEIHEMGSALEIVLITGLDDQFMLYKIIRILHEETVEVLNAHLTVMGNTILHTVHANIEESMFCFRAATIREKLKKLLGFELACDEEEEEEEENQAHVYRHSLV